MLTGMTGMAGMAQPDNDQSNNPSANQEAHPPRGSNSEPRQVKDSGQEKGKVLEIRINADALRARLNRSIIRAEQMLERHKIALAKLDDGASPSEVLADMRLIGVARNANNEQRNSQQRRPDDGPRPTPQAFTPEEREEMHEFLRENFPDLWKNLQQFADLDPRSADRLLGQMSPKIREILYLKDSEPDLAKLKILEMRVGLAFVEASRLYRAAMNQTSNSDAQREEALAVLQSAAEDRFDVQLKAKQFEIQQLEARLNELKDSVDDIELRKENEIDRMISLATRPMRHRGDRKSSPGAAPLRDD